MKKKLYLVTMLMSAMFAFSACSAQATADSNTQESTQKEQASEAASETENNLENTEGEDVQNLQQKMEDFCQAYFQGDTAAMKEFLSASFTDEIEVYEKPEEAENLKLKDVTGLKDVSELSVSKKYVLSKPFMTPEEDSMTYLTAGFIYEDGEWKISWYGLEK